MERNLMFMDRKIVKVSTPPKATYIFNATTIKILMAQFKDTEKAILKFVWEPQKHKNNQSKPEKEQSQMHHTF